MARSVAVTRGVRVEVQSRHDAERSRPQEKHWFFAYTVRITNESSRTVQLLSRHWIITDGDGRVEQVRGPGVVGKQPTLAPGQSFEYSSFCPLRTSFGTMHGTYQMVDAAGGRFDVEIAAFALSPPHAIN